MCGIAGVYGNEDVALDKLIHRLKHRGPDGQDIQPLSHSIVGHTRLAIIDLAHGQQPLNNPRQNHWLVCNGEIYNHQELRQQLPDYPYQTNSDSEVILALYAEYGPEVVHYLDGMFAFALLNEAENSIFVARDPIGIKPLFYGWQGTDFYFASEIKALDGLVDTIEEFPPGHWYTPERGLVKYYDLNQQILEISPALDLAHIRTTLTEAVHKRLMADVPVGVFLSGGLDSSLVAALASAEIPNIHSFAVGVTMSDDIQRAREVAEYIGSQHHEYILEPSEMLAALPEIIYYLESFDPALVRSAIPNYFLAKMASEHVKVVLVGEGADELYAGYHYLKSVGDTLTQELVGLTETLYNCNLRRCDRMTMAHGIEGRVPFLDKEFIKASFAVPNQYKIDPQGVEKWALRKAFEGYLPNHILWRTKSQFAEGAGSFHLLKEFAEQRISDDEFQSARRRIYQQTGYTIQDKEALFCYREFRQHFSTASLGVVQAWQGTNII